MKAHKVISCYSHEHLFKCSHPFAASSKTPMFPMAIVLSIHPLGETKKPRPRLQKRRKLIKCIISTNAIS